MEGKAVSLRLVAHDSARLPVARLEGNHGTGDFADFGLATRPRERTGEHRLDTVVERCGKRLGGFLLYDPRSQRTAQEIFFLDRPEKRSKGIVVKVFDDSLELRAEFIIVRALGDGRRRRHKGRKRDDQ